MANPQKRTYSTVYNALQQISDEEGIDFGLGGYTEQQFKDKYFTGPGNINNLYNKLSQISDEEGVDFGLGTRGEWLGSFGFTEEDAMPKQGYKPTAEEMAGFQSTIKNAGRTAIGSFDKKLQNLKKRQGLNAPSRVEVGKSNNLVQGEQRLNPETGELENTYITSFGNEYENETLADMEQRQIDQNLRDQRYKQSLPGQLDDAYAERDRLNAELGKLQGQWVDQDGRIHYGNRANDEAAASLEAALRQNQQRITALEAERDDDGGTQFWRGFIDAAKNPSNLTFGMTDFSDMMQMMRIKNKIDTAIESGQQPQLSDAEQALMESSFLNNYAQSEYGENRGFMYRAGGISMQALPFVAEFMATGGMGAISQKGAELGTRAAEKLALQGLSRTLVKNLGVLAGDVAAGWAMANTTGMFRTAGDVMQRNMGDVTINPEGQYDFGEYDDEGNYHHGGKSLGRSIYEAEVANTLEYYTEKLGEHLQIGKWLAKGADKMGLSKLSKAVNYLSGSKWLERGGIQDYPSEVVEEEANLLLNGLLVGDNNFSVDPDSKEFNNSVFNPKTQLDIWGGMLFSIGLMQAPRLAYTGTSAAGYYAYKKKVDAADGNASAVFGADNWQMIKDEIDNCENDRIGELMQTVLDGDMTEEQKNATFDYAKNLIKMRGYNMGMMADSKSEEESLSEENIASKVIDQNYQMGHETQEPDLMKQYREDVNAAIQDLPQHGEEFAKMVATSENPVETMSYLMQNRDTYSDDQIAAAADFYQKQARLNGVMDGALDRIDVQVEQANAEVRSNTHQATGNVVMAKGADDIDYYIIGGDFVTDPETGFVSLAGTGGAVVVKDSFGNVSVKSPMELTVYSMQPADGLIQQNETELRQQLMQQADDDMTFGSPANEVYQLEDTVTLDDGDGNVIEGQIGMMPNSIDGVYVVYTPDNRALQFTADQLNRMIVAHNGMEVQRASAVPNQGENVLNQPQPQPEQSGETAGGKASVESGTGANEQPASALSRIPVLQDEKGRPVMNKKGKPQYLWHKASVEDAAAALIETTGGDMLMARDTASDLVKNAQAGLEKIRKQKPKGDDPIEIAESRMEIKRQEQDQQAIIKQWQDVNQAIQKQMRDEAAARQAEIEAAKSAEQKAREAEEARQREEKQKEIDRQRIREQIEKDKERRNKEYTPLVKAREEMAEDTDALAILNDVEPRSLEEWVSSLLRPHSMLWQDASDSEIGLQSELGLKRGDMQRMISLLGTKESGAKPFGKVVLDIYEGLPEGMKNQYTDEDVRNTLLNLFNEGSSSRMMHLTEENRIEEARQTMLDNNRREAEAEMEAWAEAYHLTPEERETFEDFMSQAPTEPEQEIINNIIADESFRRSEEEDQQSVSRTDVSGSQRGKSQVQQAAQAAGNGNNEAWSAQDSEVAAGESPVSDNNVSGGGVIPTPSVDKPRFSAIRKSLTDAYSALVNSGQRNPKDLKAVNDAAKEVRKYIDEGLDDYAEYEDGIEDYEGNDPEMLADQYITRVFHDRYADNDADEIYIRTGLKPEMREHFAFTEYNGKLFEANNLGVCLNPNVLSNRDNKRNGYDIKTALSENGWVGAYDVDGPTYGGGGPVTAAWYDVCFETEAECQAFHAQRALSYLKQQNDPKMKKYEVALQAIIDKPGKKPKPIKPSEQLKPTDLRDATRVESPEIGVAEANAKAQLQSKAKGWLSDENIEWAEGRDLDEIIKKFGNKPEPIAVLPAIVRRNIPSLTDDYLYCGKAYFIDHHINHHPELDIDEYDNIQTILDSYDDIKDLSENGHLKVAFVKKLDKGYAVVVELSKENDKIMLHKTFFYKDAAGKRIPFKNKPSIKEKWSVDGSTTISPAESQQPADTEIISALDQSSVGKVTNNSANLQEKSEKSSEDIENEGEGSSETAPNGQTFMFDETGRCTNPNPMRIGGTALDVTMLTAYNGKGWVGSISVAKPLYFAGGGEIHKNDTPVFKTEEECRSHYANQAIDELKKTVDGREELSLIKALRRMASAKTEEPSAQEPEPKTKRPGTNTPEGEILVGGGTILKNNMAGGDAVALVVGSNIDKKTGKRRYTVEYYTNEQEAKERAVAIGDAMIGQDEMRQHLANGDFSKERKAEKPAQPKKNEPKRLVSDEKMEELRKKLLDKLNNLNAGIDPEMMLLGAMYAVGNIERGVTKFADYAKKMVTDLGDKIRPYLKSFYNAVRDMPEAQEYASQMDDYATVSGFDVYNFDKQQTPDAITKAEQVVTEQRIRNKAKKIQEQPDLFAGDLFGAQAKAEPKPKSALRAKAETQQKKRKPQLSDFDSLQTGKRFVTPDGTIEIARVDYDTLQVWDIDADGNRSNRTRAVDTVDVADGLRSESITEIQSPTESKSEPRLRPATEADVDSADAKWYHNGRRVYILAVTRKGEQVSATQFSKPTVESVMLTNGKSVKLGDLMVEDTSAIGETSTPAQIAAEEAKVDTNPSEAQKEAGNYQKGHIKIDGYDITIENPKGSIRRGTDASGKSWETKMHYTYGYIRGTEGVDGDHIDVFLSDNPTSGSVFVVDQVNPTTGEFDEHKCMYGFGSEEEAREAYLSNYSKGWKGLGDITEVSREDFKKWIESSHRKTKPFAEYKIAQKPLYNNGTVFVSDTEIIKIDNSRIDNTGQRQYEATAFTSTPVKGEPKGIKFQISETDLRNNLDNGMYSQKPNLDRKDYHTYMTPVAREYFAHDPRFARWSHPELAFITAAVWDGVVIPYDALKVLPEIIEAEQVVKNATKNGVLEISDKEIDRHAQHLLDKEHGSAVFEKGKIRKVNGAEDFSGPVRQERKALIIIGLPAGGKSSVFANPLSNQYGARIIDSDVVKPWLKGFDGGNGAGYVQNASSDVAERALDIAVANGDNIILPRIGGKSVITLSVALRLAGYDVQMYYNDVATVTSVDRAASRFAEAGRYLSLDYLTSKDGVPSDNFSKFAEKSIGEYLDECTEKQVQDLRRRFESLAGGQRSDLQRAIDGWLERKGQGDVDQFIPVYVERSESGSSATRITRESPIFSHAEWKSNDVAFGEKPKEIWNSESGKPMPGKKEEKNNETESKVSRKPESAGQGAGQTSGAADRTGAEPGTESDRTQRTGSGSSVENSTLASGAATSNGKDVQPQPKQNPKHNNRRNNVGERGKDYAPTSPKARFNANVEAIKLMRLLNDEGIDAPTKDQMEVLRKYSGWGGMGTFFNDESLAENKQLRDLLSEEEYNDAVMSINSAYYTPAMVIDSLWDIAKAMGFKGGNVLEGSAGIGNIIGQMPKEMSSRSNIEAVEIDSISGNILKLLYPDAKVHIEGFQDVRIPNGTVDLAVTNVPFVTGLHVIDKVDKDLSRKFTNIHDFCIAKNIRKLSEGGIGIFITSAGTMDKSNKLREWITDEGQADVVGAFRLNNTTFGGTNVTSDIVVVRKRTGNQKSPVAIDVAKASPLRVGTWTDKFGDDHQVSMVVNDYFRDHPDMMAGEMAFGYEKGDTFRPGSYGLYPVSGKEQEKMLADFAKSMSNAKETVAPRQQTEQVQNQLTAEKEGRMLVDDKGRLCVSERGVAVPLGLNDQKVKGYTKQECFADYQAVQKAVDDALQQQLNDPDDAALKPKLDALNKAYDKFTKRYGTLHKNTSISFLRNDIDFPSFQALENYSETKDMKGKVTVKTAKTPLFSQRVLGFKTEPKPKNVKDALIASIFRSNGIDLGWIAEKLNAAGVKPPHKDQWDEDDVRKGILVSRLGFEDPSTGQLEVRYKYLSGNVREKLAIAEAYNTDGKYASNVEELRKAVPMDIPSHLIEFSLGSSWIPIELYKDYLKENYDLGNVKLTHIEGSWILDEGYSYRNEKNRSAGVYSEKFRETIYGHQLVAAALNNRPVKVAKQVSEGYGDSKTTKTVVDQAATQACAVRVDEIKDDFKQFVKKKIQEDPELAQRIEKIYNDKFNALVPMQIDDEFLPDVFENANMNIHLYDHQKRGVMRGLTAPTMLAHEVGTGKSFTLISTAMEMRRLGTAKKPMIVVQNATVAQMTADAKLLYPNAKVLSLTEKDRDAEGRRAFYAKIKYNDWDLIIVPQSTFERIPDSPERELQFIQEKIDEKKHVIEAAEAAGADSRQMQQMRKELEKLEQEYGDTFLDNDPANNSQKKSRKKDAKKEAASLDKAETKAKEMLDRAVDDVQFFDDLGVDALLVDEAHEYKHLGFQTSIGRGIKGIDPSYSKKCAGLYNKTRSVFEKAGWKNVVFATGTPISNTAAEIWTFMKYLMPADVMRQNDIYYFDDFVHNFGAISQMLEFATSGKFKENTRFAAYVNKPELIRIWSQVADTVLTKEVGEVKSRVPEKEGGKDQDVFLPQSPSLISIMAAVRAELERFENMTGKEKKENSSIPLTMYGIAKRAAIDPRLVNPDAPDEPLSKTNAAVKEIVKDLKDTQSYKGTVAVFCDNQNRLGKSADGKNIVEFNIYDDMRNKLIKAGVPAEQIAIIKSGMSITAKQKVFDAVNTGAIRVVLGSTQTLGTGVNMQERLHLLIHMDAPDRPMDYTQRNGRIERQGNLHKVWNKPVRILRFGVEDSLDVTAYQRLKTKSGFIDSIMDGKGALANNQVDRTVEEEEEGLFDNPVAVLSGSQYALKKNQAERELRKYLGKKAQWEADQVYVANTLRYNSREVKNLENLIKEEEDQLKHIRSLFPDGKVKTVTVEGEKIDLSKGDADAYVKMVKVFKEKIQDPVNAIVKRNRENPIYNDESLDYKVELDGHPIDFRVDVYRTSEYENGKMRTVIHKQVNYNSPDLHIKSTMGSAKSVRELVEDIMSDVVTGNDYTDRIDAYNAKISRLNDETEQLKKRVGMEFQYGKELDEAKKHVDEYTELMKKEMEEKEAKYAAQQKEAQESGEGFDLKKAEEGEDEEVLRRSEEDYEDDELISRSVETFSEGQTFPIYQEEMFSSYNVLGHRVSYSTDLMPDEYATQQALLDALRNQYPEYYVTIEDNNVRMQSFNAVMADAEIANDAKKAKGTKSYVERKTRRAINAVEDMAKRMGLDVEVLTTTEGLTGKDAKAKGIFNKRTHKITIILPNHKTQSDVINTLLHEGVAHYGLRKMFGENFNTFLDNVYNNVDPQVKARIDAAMKRNKWSRHTATEEYLARLAERTDFENATNSGWWQKIKDFFISMLAKAGFNTILTDNELRYILWRSYDNLLHPDSRRNIFDKAREVDMMNRLKAGGYEERVPVRTSAETTPIVAEPEVDEITQIVSEAQDNGTYLKAPNGQPTNLSEEQWAQVRTKAFKNWFGDWENDPENASKVVDENGEPKVMYHGTNLTKNNNGEPFWVFYPESHFGTQGQSKDVLRNVNADQSTKTYEVFLNIRKPDRSQDVPKKYYGKSEHKEWWDALSDYAKKNGFDGIVYQNRWEDQDNPADSWIAFNSNQIKSATDNNGEYSPENDDIRYSLRTKEPPKKTGIGYKVFVLKNGQLYPPMVANPNGEGTPIGVWLDADAAPVAGTSKTGRPQVKAGGKGTQGGSGQLAYRPGWHLGEIPYALQFNRKDANGERTLFPNNFVWAEVEYADDVDYNEEARKEGTNASGKYQHSLAGLKHVPTDGSYKYRTNPDPRTDPWIITGAMRVNKILSREEVDDLVRKAGREPQPMQEGDVLTRESIDALNAEIQAMKEADEMGLLYRDDSDDVFDIARDAYEEAAASDALKFQEAWQDKMAGLKVLQNAIEKETGHKATGAEDAYLYENRMHGKAKNQSENYDRRYYRPLLKAADAMMKAKGWTEIRDLTDYLVAKHGLERNIFYAFKAAITGMVRDNINKEQRKLTKRYERGEIDAITYKKEQKKLAEREAKDIADKIKEVNNDPEHLRMLDDYENGRITYSDYITNEEDIRRSYAPDFDEHYKDYSGLTELTGDENDYTNLALKMVDAAENDNPEEVSDLWNAINAATKETLRFAYESGTMSRNTYNNVREMFNYYVPLRGWEENNADDYYDYVSERNVFSTAIKKAYGRQSLAENPLAYIGNMAVSTLLAGHKNLLKQHFLNYVMNNPTSLVSISERWWENKGTETAPYWVEVSPEIPAGATADEIADIVEAFNEEMKQKAEEGRATTTRGSLDIKYHATGAEKDEHMVEVQRAGKTYQLYINGNPKAAQALNGTNEKAVSRISQTDFGQMVEKINRNMAAFFTSKNPAFVLSNLSRDLTMAGASVAVKEDAAYNAQFIKNVVKVLRPRAGRGAKYGFARKVTLGMYGKDTYGITGLLPSLMRKYIDGDLDLSNETERLFGEFMDEGGETGFVNMLSVDSFKEKMQKEIGQMNGTTLNIAKARKGTKETPIGRGLRLMGDIFEFYNRCAEDATRFIVYMTSRQMGKSLEDSIADAKDVTLNFNRKGTGSKWNAVVRDLFIFVNPAVQALANMFKMAYKHPLKLTAVTAAFMAGGALIPVFNQWLLNLFGDDDDKDAYWNLPPWVRKNNLVLWVPGTKNFITIPLAQEFRVFYGLGEMATSLTYDHPVHEWPMEILSSFMDLVPINPTGNGGNLVTDLTPTMFQPMSQLAFNTDFTGKPIWRENQGNKYAPMYTKAYVSTPEWMISLSEGINDLTGGNEGKKGWVEEYLYGGDYINNPAVWNHLMQGYFGGMYNTIAKTFDVGVTAAKGELPKVYQTPVLNRFLNRPVERDNAGVLGDEYYALTEERDRLKYELRTWQKKADEGDADAQEHVDEIMQSEDYQRMLVIDHYDKIMKDLKAGEKAAKADYDKEDIKDMITMYKAQMMDELADIDGGMDPLEAAKAKFNSAKTKSERARLSKRIERLTMRQGESKKSGDDAVDKALSYRADDLKDKQEGRRESGDYLKLATAENIADDARIRIAKQKIKQYTDEYKRLVTSGNSDRAGEYRKQNQKYFVADGIIQSQSRAISTNKKLLGKGHDEAIMKLIDANRQRMLKAIEGLE